MYHFKHSRIKETPRQP